MRYQVWLQYTEDGYLNPTEELVAVFKYKTQALRFVSSTSNDRVSARVAIVPPSDEAR